MKFRVLDRGRTYQVEAPTGAAAVRERAPEGLLSFVGITPTGGRQFEVKEAGPSGRVTSRRITVYGVRQ